MRLQISLCILLSVYLPFNYTAKIRGPSKCSLVCARKREGCWEREKRRMKNVWWGVFVNVCLSTCVCAHMFRYRIYVNNSNIRCKEVFFSLKGKS